MPANEGIKLSGRRNLSEDNESKPIKSKKKSIRFGNNDEVDFDRDVRDTPPTRSRSRKGRVAFDEPIPTKSALKNANTGSKSDKSRSRSKSAGRSTSAVRRQPMFEPPKFGSSGNTRLDAFEAKFDKYRANKR